MTERVDFYVLKNANPAHGWAFACRLTEKVYLLSMRVAILAETEADARNIDELLWTFNDRSFVPHALVGNGESGDPSTPVQLTADAGNVPQADLLINLSGRMPQDPTRYARIAEIIDSDEERRRLGRERYKSYRDMQIALETHHLDGNSDS
jgi:DNA polymerase-3 subunit chi